MTQMTVKTYLIDCDLLKDEALFSRYLATVSEARRNKTNRLKMPADKRLSLGAGILLKAALKDFADLPETTNEHGKPYIAGCPWQYSISHSGHYAFLAVAESAVGCDVQEMLTKDTHKIARRFFTESENALIDSAEMFYRLWCVKESYLKMCGTGMAKPLDSFEVQMRGGAPYIDDTCTVREFPLADGYRFSVCVSGSAVFEETQIIKEL